MSGLPKPCLGCGEDVLTGSRCKNCRKPRTRREPSAAKRGYDYRWQALSREARKLQPFCTDCQRPHAQGNPLTLDHTPAAWQKLASGKRLTLKDVAQGLCVVRCMECNNVQGAARGVNVTRTD